MYRQNETWSFLEFLLIFNVFWLLKYYNLKK